jgi:hypothetical protein
MKKMVEKYQSQIKALEERLKVETNANTYALLKTSVAILETVIQDLEQLLTQ